MQDTVSHVGVPRARHCYLGCHLGVLPALHPAELLEAKQGAWHAYPQACAALEVPRLPWTHAEFSLSHGTHLLILVQEFPQISEYNLIFCVFYSLLYYSLSLMVWLAHVKGSGAYVVDFLFFLFSKRKQPNLIQTCVWEPCTHERVRLHMQERYLDFLFFNPHHYLVLLVERRFRGLSWKWRNGGIKFS